MMLRKGLLCVDYSKQLDVDNRLLAVAQHLQAQCVTDERFNQFAEYMIFRMSQKIYIIRDIKRKKTADGGLFVLNILL